MSFMIDRYPHEESPRLGSMSLRPTPESVPLARRWFRKLIAPYEPRCSVDDCLLAISELVTNALVHGHSDNEWALRIEWFREGTSLRVEVHNPGCPEGVRLTYPDADDSHGRGLLLVDSIATSWDCGPSRLGGTGCVLRDGRCVALRQELTALGDNRHGFNAP